MLYDIPINETDFYHIIKYTVSMCRRDRLAVSAAAGGIHGQQDEK